MDQKNGRLWTGLRRVVIEGEEKENQGMEQIAEAWMAGLKGNRHLRIKGAHDELT